MLCHGAPASISTTAPPLCSRSATAPRPAAPPWRPVQQIHHGAPCQRLLQGASASNKPHPAEKSTPLWLAIWHIWAGFADSQLRCAIFHSNYSCKCPSPLLPPWSCCSDIANLSAHLHRLPTPPPHLRRMRLSHGLVRRSCNSPRARILVLGTSGAHWPARWPRFELTEHVDES